jgi:uncharacterized coiled-coil protein SlyX
LEELKSIDYLNPKIAEKNAQIRSTRQQIDTITDRQRELNHERLQQEDAMK